MKLEERVLSKYYLTEDAQHDTLALGSFRSVGLLVLLVVGN